MKQVLPHPFVELVMMAHRRGSFDRSVRELSRHIGRNVQTKEHRVDQARARCVRESRAEAPVRPLAGSKLASGSNVTSSLRTSDEYTTGIEYSCAEEAGEVQMGHSSASASAEEGSDDGGVSGDDR
jgi:hypothetical protein